MRTGRTRDLCEYGWDVLTRQTRAKNALREHLEAREAESAGQLELFSLPE